MSNPSLVITQLAPLSDSVSAGLSETYANQLNVAGSTGILTYSTTSAPEGLVVTSFGQVVATGSLLVGSYYVNGFVTDSNGNTGIWSFGLTVVGAITPGTGVTPIQPTLPLGVEVLVPFQIDPTTGGIAVITDYGSILSQHIETIIMTAINERVMNPTYGYGLEKEVFAPINVGLPSLLQADIATAITKWEKKVTVLGVSASNSPTSPSLLTVTVTFAVAPFNDVNTVSVSTGGTIAQVNNL